MRTPSRERCLKIMLHVMLHRFTRVTAQIIAIQAGVSIRTAYRDLALLRDLGFPIQGTAGEGYVWKPDEDWAYKNRKA